MFRRSLEVSPVARWSWTVQRFLRAENNSYPPVWSPRNLRFLASSFPWNSVEEIRRTDSEFFRQWRLSVSRTQGRVRAARTTERWLVTAAQETCCRVRKYWELEQA